MFRVQVNEEMKHAASSAIRVIARKSSEFGRDYIIPKPHDPRLMVEVSYAVMKAAVSSGVARVKPKRYKLRLHDIALRVITKYFIDPPHKALNLSENEIISICIRDLHCVYTL